MTKIRRLLRRNTSRRKAILEELRKLKTHPTADDIYKTVKKRVPEISFATVYRNLGILKEQGELLELDCGAGSSRYDGCVRNHYHFICLGCSRVFDMEEPVFLRLDRIAEGDSDFDIRYHRVNFYGYCGKCRRTNKNKKEAGK